MEKHPSSSYKTVYIGKKQNNLSTFCTDVLYISEAVQEMYKLEKKKDIFKMVIQVMIKSGLSIKL